MKGLPQTFIIVGSLDLFCDEDIDYAKKLMQAGVFTELYVEPGLPHAYDALDGTPQTERFDKLRNNATVRMLGIKNNQKEEIKFVDILKYLFNM